MSLFKVVHKIDPLSPLDLPWPLDQKSSADAKQRVVKIQKIHEQFKAKIRRSNMSYQAQANKHEKKVVFQSGDLNWIHLEKKSFPLNKMVGLCQELKVHLRSHNTSMTMTTRLIYQGTMAS